MTLSTYEIEYVVANFTIEPSISIRGIFLSKNGSLIWVCEVTWSGTEIVTKSLKYDMFYKLRTLLGVRTKSSLRGGIGEINPNLKMYVNNGMS